MSDRSYRIALQHLALTDPPADDAEKPDTKVKEGLPESKIREIASETITRGYPSILGPYLRNMDIVQLISAGDFVTKQYSPTGFPRKELATAILNIKNKVLTTLFNLAVADKKSIIDEVVTYVKKDTELMEDDVAAYTRDLLADIKSKTRNYVRRTDSLSGG